MDRTRARPLRILQVFRAPVGGLFRHVRDLVRGLSELGHEIGVVCDSLTGGAEAERQLLALQQHCRLGIHRIAMHRLPGLGDAASARAVARLGAGLEPDILHGHGAKGGAYARLAARRLGAAAVYTPHGGSLHYAWRTPHGVLFLAAERALLGRTAGLIFVCEYEREAFSSKIGLSAVPNIVIHNGLWPEEFEPVSEDAQAADILYVGELRRLKGVDVLIEALGYLARAGNGLSANIVGAGSDREAFEKRVDDLALRRVSFLGPMPARKAFARGRVLVVPSRAEAFPYIVLEAVAAGKPVVASKVGGIGEMLPPAHLVEPGDPRGLAEAILTRLTAAVKPSPEVLREEFKHRFAARGMAAKAAEFYLQLAAGISPQLQILRNPVNFP